MDTAKEEESTVLTNRVKKDKETPAQNRGVIGLILQALRELEANSDTQDLNNLKGKLE